MIQPGTERAARPRRRQAPLSFAHGWARAGDPIPRPIATTDQSRRRLAPAGTSLLLLVIVVALAVVGITRVRATTRVLELGATITELTDEQSQLQEQKRRLLAERAYLRHPDQISETARNQLGMVPVAPDLVQKIRVVEEAKR